MTSAEASRFLAGAQRACSGSGAQRPELMPPHTDALQETVRRRAAPIPPLNWKGDIPQVVVFDPTGDVVFR